VGWRQASLDETGSHRLDALERLGDAALVVGERNGDGERLADEKQPRRVGALELDGPREAQQVVFVRLDDDVRGLDLAYSQRSGNPLRQILQQLLLLDRRHIDEHDGARLEQHRHAAARSAKGQWVSKTRPRVPAP
jgi:hypothetical protein